MVKILRIIIGLATVGTLLYTASAGWPMGN
jgi:hypothetical protein